MTGFKKVLLLILAGFFISGCANMTKTQKGALIGGATGAGVGGLIGSKSGNTAKGAIIGGIVGAVTGGLIGNYMDRQAAELEKVADTKRVQDGIVVTMKDKVLFDTNSSVLRLESKESIRKIAEVLKKYPKTDMTVAGYTDNVGSETYNQMLSERRTEAVKFFLVETGVKGARIATMGFGEENPVAHNDTSEGRQQNRRVELHIVPSDELVAESQGK